jgi:cytochrome P450
VIEFDLLSDEFQDAPAAMFATLRDECPVHRTMRPAEHYVLSRAADVIAALRDEETWS